MAASPYLINVAASILYKNRTPRNSGCRYGDSPNLEKPLPLEPIRERWAMCLISVSIQILMETCFGCLCTGSLLMARILGYSSCPTLSG